MLITRKSPFSGKVHTLDINVTQEQIDKWQSGTLIQNAMPHLNADDREFLMTGITKEEWDSLFNSSGEDHEDIVDDDSYEDAIVDDMNDPQDDNDEDGSDDDLK